MPPPPKAAVPTVEALVELLAAALRDPLHRPALLKRFQELVWNDEGRSATPDQAKVLRDLANDLDFFEPSAVLRAEDPAYFGDARCAEELRSALSRLAPHLLG